MAGTTSSTSRPTASGQPGELLLVGVPDYRVVPNDFGRYNFNTYSGLAWEPDGSLKIGVGPSPAHGVSECNWLPSAPVKPFSLTFRAYVPRTLSKTATGHDPR